MAYLKESRTEFNIKIMLTFIIINTKVIIKTCIVYITFKIDSLCSQVYISNTESVHIIDNFLLYTQPAWMY